MKYYWGLLLFLLFLAFGISNAVAQPANDILRDIEKGEYLSNHTGDSSCLSLFLHALDESKKRNYSPGIITTTKDLSYEYSMRGNRLLSRYYANECLYNALRNDDLTDAAIAYHAIGNTYHQDGSYDTSFNYYDSSLKLIKSILLKEKKDSTIKVLKSTLASVYCNIGLLLLRTDRLDRALSYFDMSEEIARSVNFKRGISNVLGYKALYYLSINDFKKAKGKADEALKISEEDSIIWPRQKALNVLGDIYSLSDPVKALKYYQQGIDLARYYPNQQLYIIQQMAELYLKLGQTAKCKSAALSVYQIAASLNRPKYILSAITLLAQALAREGDYKNAFNYQMQAVSLKDSIDKTEKNSKLNQLELKYRTSEKDKAIAQNKLLIAQQNNKLARKNIFIITACCIVVILIVAFTAIYMYRKRVFEQRLTELKQHEDLNTLLAIVKGEEKERSRLGKELHDGIGGMLSITRMYIGNLAEKDNQLALSDDYTAAAMILDDTIAELRKIAHNLLPEQLMNLGLTEAIRAFCNTVQKTNKIRIDFQSHGLSERIDVNLELFIYRTVQELVQNIIKHSAATQALVQLSMYDSVFSITVEDNGIGIADNYKDKGMGLELISARVKQLNGHMNIRSGTGSGTSIYVELELI